jgi:elongation factor G
MKDSITGDTLCDIQHPILLERIQFAEAVVSQAIEPESSADKDKLEKVLNLLGREDPTFTWRLDRDTGQTVMSGMGTLHLEIKRHRMEGDFRLKIRVYPPRVSYRETIRQPVQVVGECVHQAGTSGQFAKVAVRFEPYAGPEPIRVETLVEPEVLPPEFLAAAEQGIRGALNSGELGYPVMKVRATMVGGEMEEHVSNEMAFQAAGADAVHKAMRDNIVLLEPKMALEVTVPEEYLGAITSDLNARRAEINEILTRGRLRVVEATVALRQVFDYANTVRGLSQGRASYTMEPHEYAPAPDDVLRALLHPEEAY